MNKTAVGVVSDILIAMGFYAERSRPKPDNMEYGPMGMPQAPRIPKRPANVDYAVYFEPPRERTPFTPDTPLDEFQGGVLEIIPDAEDTYSLSNLRVEGTDKTGREAMRHFHPSVVDHFVDYVKGRDTPISVAARLSAVSSELAQISYDVSDFGDFPEGTISGNHVHDALEAASKAFRSVFSDEAVPDEYRKPRWLKEEPPDGSGPSVPDVEGDVQTKLQLDLGPESFRKVQEFLQQDMHRNPSLVDYSLNKEGFFMGFDSDYGARSQYKHISKIPEIDVFQDEVTYFVEGDEIEIQGRCHGCDGPIVHQVKYNSWGKTCVDCDRAC